MLYRSIIDELNKWAASKNRKPLILRGARQVGKTTGINQAPHCFAIRLYSAELLFQRTTTTEGKEFVLLNLPYFLAFKILDYIEWMKKNHTTLLS